MHMPCMFVKCTLNPMLLCPALQSDLKMSSSINSVPFYPSPFSLFIREYTLGHSKGLTDSDPKTNLQAAEISQPC